MTDAIEMVSTRWRLDPPARVRRAYRDGLIEVHLVIRDVRADGSEHWAVRGIPLTSKGNPNGGIDYRHVTDEAMAELRARVLVSDEGSADG